MLSLLNNDMLARGERLGRALLQLDFSNTDCIIVNANGRLGQARKLSPQGDFDVGPPRAVTMAALM
jgi:hypothetical protein